MAVVNSSYLRRCKSSVAFSSSNVLLYCLHTALIFSIVFLCVWVPFSVFCNTAKSKFKSSISFFVVSWNSPVAVVASFCLPVKRVIILTNAPINPITQPIGLLIMEAQRAFTATVAFVVIAVSTEVTAPCVVFAVVSATEAAVDCLVAVASSSFFFA